MSLDPAHLHRLLPGGARPLEPLLPAPAGPFWRAGRGADGPEDYADGLEELIADYNRQSPEQIIPWAQRHPLTTEERFILEYNTSPDRANVIRPLPLVEGTRVLEVGAGCGPVSQFLWSRCQTLSVEASPARARAAVYRLARHSNPHGSALLCADFHELAGDGSFDWVIFNGVLEYAATYSGAREPAPHAALLRRAAAFLRPGGRCVVTIENRLGLKYFAGAPEDHYGRPAVGLEGYRTLGTKPVPIRTFSKPALSRLFTESGYREPSYLFPFPDYKFAKVILADDRASWRFATERLIGISPAWRSPRTHGFDEPAAFRSLVDDGLAAEFAHSFLAMASKEGPAAAALLPTAIHYFPLKRDPDTGVRALFDLPQGRVLRHRLDGGRFAVPSDFPQHAPGNPRARFNPPVMNPERTELIQPLSPAPTLWEGFRSQLGHTIDPPDAYGRQLGENLGTILRRHFSCLPFQDAGDWPAFVGKLGQKFARSGLEERSAGALTFLHSQRPFAESSLRRLAVSPWSMWAPDWILENLFPAGDGVAFFDMEYVDTAACLPTPVLVYRQLRILQAKVASPGLAACWPWPTRRLQARTSQVDLPSIAANLAMATLWPNTSGTESDRDAWFWSKVAEIVECAMTSTVVAPFTKAYETAPWLEKLAAELTPLAGADLATTIVDVAELTQNPTLAAGNAVLPDELIVKEQQIARLAAISQERERSLVQSNREADRLRAEAARLAADLLATHAEIEQLVGVTKQREQALVESTAEADRLRAGTATLATDLQTKEAAVFAAHAEIEQQTAAATERGRSLTESSAEVKQLAATAQERANALVAAGAEADQLRAAAKEREHALVAATAEANQLRATADGLIAEMETKERHLLAAHVELKQLAATASQREQALVASSAEADRLRASAVALAADLRAKEIVIADLINTCDERLRLINRITAGKTAGPP